MSYKSESILSKTVKLLRLQEVIESLGYKKIRDPLKATYEMGSYFWHDAEDYRSWSGIQLSIYQTKGRVTITTHSTASRSYWDLKHQNKTVRLIRDLFGGHFFTDAGRNRCWSPAGPPPTPLSSGCFLARWRFQNALGRARIYLQTRKLEGVIAREKPTGIPFFDEFNPRLLSNNLLLPFVVAVWEEYFRSTFAAVLTYSRFREGVLKRARLSHAQLEQIAMRTQPFEKTIAECFYFQRPSMISENFKLIDQNLDIGGALKKPYKRRKVTHFDSIEEIVESRNAFVHTGEMNLGLYDKQINSTFQDFVEAVDRAYDAIGKHYAFTPIHDY
jgi:hypothetical protein